MRGNDTPGGGWEFVAEREAAARLLDALIDLDPEAECTKTELAEATGVPLKTLYLNDLVGECVDLGLLEEVDEPDEAAEARFRLDADSDLLAAAAAFDDAFRSQTK